MTNTDTIAKEFSLSVNIVFAVFTCFICTHLSCAFGQNFSELDPKQNKA